MPSKKKSPVQRRIFVLDTNVLMHDPSAIFRFEEHDVFIPMIVLEELDAGKRGVSESARNVRQVARFLDELMASATKEQIDRGLALPNSNYSNGGKRPALIDVRGCCGELSIHRRERLKDCGFAVGDGGSAVVEGFLKQRFFVLVPEDEGVRRLKRQRRSGGLSQAIVKLIGRQTLHVHSCEHLRVIL